MIEDPVLDNKDGFQGPIARRDLLQMYVHYRARV